LGNIYANFEGAAIGSIDASSSPTPPVAGNISKISTQWRGELTGLLARGKPVEPNGGRSSGQVGYHRGFAAGQ